MSVLVVEDNEDGADSLAMLLRLYGHRVAVARTGGAALALADGELPDVALVDIRLPDLDGWAVARGIRDLARGRDKRPLLVAVTGCVAEADRARSADAGFDLHLDKPVEPAVLAGVLTRFRRLLAPPDGRRPPPPGGDSDDDSPPARAAEVETAKARSVEKLGGRTRVGLGRFATERG